MTPPLESHYSDRRRRREAIPGPMLSDEAVVQIHDFIHHLLDRFEARYGDQLRRFYEDLCGDCLIEPDTNFDLDDPPF